MTIPIGHCSGGCGYPATRRLLLVGGIEPPEPVLVCEAAARNYGLHLTRLLPKPPALPTDPDLSGWTESEMRAAYGDR